MFFFSQNEIVATNCLSILFIITVYLDKEIWEKFS